jgi:hypothetical protein
MFTYGVVVDKEAPMQHGIFAAWETVELVLGRCLLLSG